MNPIIAGIFGVGGAEMLVIFMIIGVLFVFAAIPAILAYIVLSRIPPQFRKQEPGMAFLLLIPLFSLVWNFFVHPRVAESMKAYSDANGVHQNGDCGSSLALGFCICCVCSLIPFLGILSGVASLILLIIFYVKAFDLVARIPKTA